MTQNLCLLPSIKKKIQNNNVLMDKILEHNRTLFLTRNHADVLYKLLAKL